MQLLDPLRLPELAKHTFKKSGVARSGFEYQDLIGIDVLLRFYRDPTLFYWVELESEEKKVGRLDDVVAARTDNSFEVLQVKFTPDPETYFLDWNWLLTKKKVGTSFLQKWSASLASVASLGPVHSAKLRTNRRPDSDFAKSLHNGFIDYDKIEDDARTKVAVELGGETAARAFFSRFEFAHSEPLIDDLEIKLKGEIVPSDTDDTGWLLLRDAARRSAINKTWPEQDGKIRHAHLVQIITKRRPKPMPQDFEIPSLYQLPVKRFHEDVLERITSGVRPVTVLWGSPGRGKSTYLSYLVEMLRKDDVPTIRHHYFLALDDNTVDRVSFGEICSSLMNQMAARHLDAVRGLNERPDELRNWVEACGAHYEKEGKRFCVVIDGLDHVWREQRNTAQMEHLFNYLLPCPANVVLLVGTQKVAAEQLPLKLLRTANNDDWFEVPPMDETAVHGWLQGQNDAGRLLLRDIPHPSDGTELSQVSRVFSKISNGNPLHLIYSFEALVRRGVIVTADEVNLMPTCPDGDIRKYYGGLWGKLPADAKKVLHIVAGSDFHWPADGLRRCAGALDAVGHLLQYRRTDVIPFHGSILAYAREQQDHESTFRSALPTIIKWLAKDAPEYWRWAWLWIMRARSGDAHDLLTNTTRPWVLQSLARGWPAEQIVAILENAERCAFDASDYSRTLELRCLKIRVQNGQDYQISRFGDFEESAIRLSGNVQQIANMANAITSLDSSEVVTIVRCLAGKERDGIGDECYEELRRQVNLWISLRHQSSQKFMSLVQDFIEVLVDCGTPDMKTLLKFIDQFDARDRLYNNFLRHVVRVRNFEMAHEMLGLLDSHKYAGWRAATQDAVVRIAGVEGIALDVRLGPQRDVSPLLACWYTLKGMPIPAPCNFEDISSSAIREHYDYGPNIAVEKFFCTIFFASVVTAFHAVGDSSPALVGIDRSKLRWMKEGIDVFWKIGCEIAKHPAEMDYGSVFLGMADLEPLKDVRHRPSEPSAAQYRAFRTAARHIAADLHTLKCARDGFGLVPKDSLQLARGSTHWVDEGWIADELAGRSLMFDPTGVKALVEELEATEANHVTQFSERAEKWIDLAQLSALYNLDGTRFVLRAANCIVGYGWRKDVWIFDVLSAMRVVHKSGKGDIVPWMKTLAPIIDQITTFTDGDETNHAPEEFIDLIAEIRADWLPDVYAYYIANDEWHLAEKVLAGILSQIDFQSVASIALVKSLLDKDELNELDRLHKRGNAGAGKLLAAQRSFLGIVASRKMPANSKNAGAKQRGRSDDIGRRGKPPNITEFGPDELEALLKRVATPKLGYLHQADSLLRWMTHWATRGKGLEVLKSLDHYFATHENPHEIEACLDEAFKISLKYQGKAKAYVWLVRAHIERHGWSAHWDTSERVQKRLELVAKYYKARWAQFISDTSKPARYWERRRSAITIGTRWLVTFLILVDQNTLAVKFTESMVRLTRDEMNDQPIPALEWLR